MSLWLASQGVEVTCPDSGGMSADARKLDDR
jgi:hypothetical protein